GPCGEMSPPLSRRSLIPARLTLFHDDVLSRTAGHCSSPASGCSVRRFELERPASEMRFIEPSIDENNRMREMTITTAVADRRNGVQDAIEQASSFNHTHCVLDGVSISSNISSSIGYSQVDSHPS